MSNDNVRRDRMQKEQNWHRMLISIRVHSNEARGKIGSKCNSGECMHDFYFDSRGINHLALCWAIITVSIYFTRGGFLAAELIQKEKQIRVMCALKLFIIFMFQFLYFALFLVDGKHTKSEGTKKGSKLFACNMICALFWWRLCYF